MPLQVSTPNSTLTRPANTTAYAQNNLIANSTTASQVVLPMIAVATQIAIPRIRFYTNVTTGWGGAVIRVRFWALPPVYTNGDGGAYVIASGSAKAAIYSGFDVTLTQLADGALGETIPNVGNAVYLGGGYSVYWDMQLTSSSAVTPISGQQFIMTPEIVA